ncbi:MAG: Nucleotidyltransferase domain protein [Candidatus Methanofastidiosum methylothiophilum]|uniref:protein adenylyltransferase n=1 Tax=Candidatus Methanofastidiosum methylothiophilum TaxID=1705564 RepID=A0A150IM69_9EURY|nr:MAG: Nucleotidyltransferase domain protein [Candidatus Methanofastidiosum methylthiophilus]KYC48749.1 MAG: Nucleotidyltransferase domain protein [Candidatus Methanofastidiosum methylthiophilus]KYC51397.1 MAG: Nucleotidyltransferase domain protein [Candidatus Methanofastidiosum methylthiophilus]
MNSSERNKKLVSFLTKHGARKIGLFGSVSRGEERPDSDIDILIEFNGDPSLLDVVVIEQEASKLIGKKIDLVTEDALSPYIKDKVMKEVVMLYEEQRAPISNFFS